MPDPVDGAQEDAVTAPTPPAPTPPAPTPPAPSAPVNAPGLNFRCSICGDPSGEICVWCTKDACALHLCEHCRRCSDCCLCRQQDDRR